MQNTRFYGVLMIFCVKGFIKCCHSLMYIHKSPLMKLFYSTMYLAKEMNFITCIVINFRSLTTKTKLSHRFQAKIRQLTV